MTLFTPENTEASKTIATWKSFGNNIVYQVRLEPNNRIHEHLGTIKLRADGRWNWRRMRTKFHKWATGQGVALTEKEAKAKVLEGWT